MSGNSLVTYFRVAAGWLIKSGFVAIVTAISWFNVPAAIIAISAAVLVALQSRASTLIELSFGPLRAKLEREVTQAELLVEELKQMALLQAKAVVGVGVRTGRWADESDWIFRTVKETEEALKRLGLDEDALREARAEFVRYTASDLGNAAMGHSRVPLELGDAAVREWQEIKRRQLGKTPDEIEAFLARWDRLTPERKVRIDDMRWVLEHQDVRDRDQYLRGQTPVEWGDG